MVQDSRDPEGLNPWSTPFLSPGVDLSVCVSVQGITQSLVKVTLSKARMLWIVKIFSFQKRWLKKQNHTPVCTKVFIEQKAAWTLSWGMTVIYSQNRDWWIFSALMIALIFTAQLNIAECFLSWSKYSVEWCRQTCGHSLYLPQHLVCSMFKASGDSNTHRIKRILRFSTSLHDDVTWPSAKYFMGCFVAFMILAPHRVCGAHSVHYLARESGCKYKLCIPGGKLKHCSFVLCNWNCK